LFKYGIAHNWCRENPVTSNNLKLHGAKMPSDADAVRIHVLSPAEEMLYFETCKRLAAELRAEAARAKGGAVWPKQRAAQAFDDLYDVGRLMLLQGPRPSEVLSTKTEHVDVARAEWRIAAGKSRAARRVLDLTPESRGILECAACQPAPMVSCLRGASMARRFRTWRMRTNVSWRHLAWPS